MSCFFPYVSPDLRRCSARYICRPIGAFAHQYAAAEIAPEAITTFIQEDFYSRRSSILVFIWNGWEKVKYPAIDGYQEKPAGITGVVRSSNRHCPQWQHVDQRDNAEETRAVRSKDGHAQECAYQE